MRRTARGFILVLLCFSTIACGSTPDTSAPGHTFEQWEEGGVVTALSSAVPKYEGELFTYEPWYILQEDEREESLLVRPEPGTLDERGFLFVPDSSPSDWPSVSRIAVFDTSGIFQFAFGQPGQGPGDMRHPQINDIRDGVIETFDLVGQHRLTRYRIDGGLIDVETLPAPPPGWRTAFCRRLSDGRFLWILGRTTAGEGARSLRYRAAAYSAQWDSLWSADGEEVVEALRVEFFWNETQGAIFSRIPFGPRSHFACHDRFGLLLTTGEEPVLDIHGMDGRHRRRIRVDLPSEPVTAADRTAFEVPTVEALETATGIDRAWQKALLENLVYPEYKAYWGEDEGGTIEIDDAGRIWVRIPVFIESQEGNEPPVLYRVFSPEGEYLGITRLPPGSRRGMTKLTRGCLVQVEEDRETGAKKVVVYRIRTTVPPGSSS